MIMTYKECVIISAYTGYLMCDFDDVHKYIEETIGGPIWIHELANKDCQAMIHEAVKPDFLALCKHKERK